MPVYRTSPIKRDRRTSAQIQSIRDALYSVLESDHPMTVRQVFYQMTSLGTVPKTEAAYKGIVCRLLAEMRLQGQIPFGWISDNTRWMRKPDTYDSLEDALAYNLQTYRRSLWTRMPAYVEIWIEKDALAGVVLSVTAQWDVPLMVTRGYPSLSYTYEAAQVIAKRDKPAYIYYMGDYDPSGLDIARTLEERLREFAPDAEIHFDRIAVTPDQIEYWNLPSRPTKKQDTRSKRFGNADSVELDAIPAHNLRSLVEGAILQHLDTDEFYRLQDIERAERETLAQVVSNMRGEL